MEGIIVISEKETFKRNIGKTIGMFAGLILAAIGLLMMISIILLIPGIGGVLMGLVISTVSMPKASVNCPNCDYENKVELKKASKECERCKENLPIEWVK